MLRDTDLADDAAEAFDPLSDIFFSAIAILFVALIAVGPLGGQSPTAPDQPPDALDRVTYKGQQLPLMLAKATGVHIEGVGHETVPLDQIQTSPRLKAAIDKVARMADARLLLMIEPDGGEAVFLLDPIFAEAKIRSIVQVRLSRACGDVALSNWLRSCLPDSLAAVAP